MNDISEYTVYRPIKHVNCKQQKPISDFTSISGSATL